MPSYALPERKGSEHYMEGMYIICVPICTYAVNTSTLRRVLFKLANSSTVLDSSVGSITLYYDSLSVCM